MFLKLKILSCLDINKVKTIWVLFFANFLKGIENIKTLHNIHSSNLVLLVKKVLDVSNAKNHIEFPKFRTNNTETTALYL